MLEAQAALAQCSPSAILDAGASSFRNNRDLLPSRAFRENVKHPTRCSSQDLIRNVEIPIDRRAESVISVASL